MQHNTNIHVIYAYCIHTCNDNTHITQIAVHIHYTQYINFVDIDIHTSQHIYIIHNI